MEHLSYIKLKMKTVAIFSFLIGGSYFLFPEIEEEARFWGILSILASILILVGVKFLQKKQFVQWIGLFGFLLLAFAQLLPIHAWTFSPMITDSIEGYFLASLSQWSHLGVIPHLFVFSLSLHIALVLGSGLFKKKLEVVSIFVLFAISASIWSLVWLADLNRTVSDVFYQNNPQTMDIEIDQLQYQLKEVAKEVNYEDAYWDEGDGGFWFSSKELGIRFFVPELWLTGNPNERSIYPEVTSFKGGVIMGEKWKLNLLGEGYGIWPTMEAYKDFYPASESFLYPLNGDSNLLINGMDALNTAYFSDSNAQTACEAFSSLVLASTACEKIDGLDLNVYQLEYATYTNNEFFSVEEDDPRIVGGLIWFVSLDGFESDYNGFWIHLQSGLQLEDEAQIVDGMEVAAQNYLDQDVLYIKASSDYQEYFEVALMQLLSSIEAY